MGTQILTQSAKYAMLHPIQLHGRISQMELHAQIMDFFVMEKKNVKVALVFPLATLVLPLIFIAMRRKARVAIGQKLPTVRTMVSAIGTTQL
jgi:hypothetical protein